MAEPQEGEEGPKPQPRALLALLALAAVTGLLVSFAAWGFLEATHQVQVYVFTTLPHDLGYHGEPPYWLYVAALALSGLLTGLAIQRLPGNGGHVAANGLAVGGSLPQPRDAPGIILAGMATISLGAVLGPEAPLIGFGSALGVMTIRAVRRDTPDQVQAIMGAAGSFAAVSMIFSSPILAALLLLEALGLDRKRMPLVLLPGLLAAGIGSLTSTGLGSITGLNTSDYALDPLKVAAFPTPTVPDFGWTILLAAGVAVLCVCTRLLGLRLHPHFAGREAKVLPLAGAAMALIAVAFDAITGQSAQNVLFSGQDQLPGLVAGAESWSVSALIFVLLFKGLVWGVSLGGFRGGPTFPALFIGAAAGILASQLPGFDMTPAIGVGMAAGVVAILKLPVTAVVLSSVLIEQGGAGSGPLIIVGVVVAYLVTLAVEKALQMQETGGEPAPPAT